MMKRMRLALEIEETDGRHFFNLRLIGNYNMRRSLVGKFPLSCHGQTKTQYGSVSRPCVMEGSDGCGVRSGWRRLGWGL